MRSALCSAAMVCVLGVGSWALGGDEAAWPVQFTDVAARAGLVLIGLRRVGGSGSSSRRTARRRILDLRRRGCSTRVSAELACRGARRDGPSARAGAVDAAVIATVATGIEDVKIGRGA